MSLGDCEVDGDLRAAWKQFCRRLEEAGEYAFKDTISPYPLHRMDAFRLLTQNLGQAFDLSLETKNTKYPIIYGFCSPFCKLGGDNADFTYQQAWIDGNSTYRITGNRGSSRFFNIAVHGSRVTSNPDAPEYRPLHEPFGDIPEVNLFGHEIEISWDGSFELFIGGEKRAPNWLPTTPETRKLFIRNGFDDLTETSAQIRIERLGMDEPRPMPTTQEMIEAMDWSGDFLTTMMQDYPEWAFQFAEDLSPENINQFPSVPRDLNNIVNNVDTDRRRGRSIYAMCWQLEPDEAMIIEWDENDLFWMLTNMGVYMHSMDYLYRPVSYTPSRTKVDSDGKIRMVMAHRDPGYYNWIDTQAFQNGYLCNRNMLTDYITEFRTQVVKHVALDNVMPADSATVTAEERSEMLRHRFHCIMRRYLL